MAIDVTVRPGTDSALIAWNAPPIADCRGFALKRRIVRGPGSAASPNTVKSAGKDGVAEEIVASWVGFANGPDVAPGTRKPTTEWPIQGYLWTDHAVMPGDRVSYSVIPMLGPASALHAGAAAAFTPPVTIGERGKDKISAYFNNGIVASQWVSRHLNSADPSKSLEEAIATPGSDVRNYLSGELREKLVSLLKETIKNGGEIYNCLFELDDPELIDLVKQLGKRAHLVLGNGAVKLKGEDENAAARGTLKAAGCDVHDRMTAPRALAHNKFMVICDKAGTPVSVWTGSTNWTKTGLCTQANNALFSEDPADARIYLNQWKLLSTQGDLSPKTLLAANGKSRVSGDAEIWFTPMGNQLDLKSCGELIKNAKEGVLFLMFNPGPRDSLLNDIIDLTDAKSADYRPDLYIEGVCNQNPGTAKNPVTLFKRGTRIDPNADVVLPAAIGEHLKYWQPELLKLPQSHAMVHSKVVVIDPYSANPIVITGSHNLGPKASGVNDENMFIVHNNATVASQYASKVLQIYSEYKFRSRASAKEGLWKGLRDDDSWQIKDAKDPHDTERLREIDFWRGVPHFVAAKKKSA